MNNVKEWKKLGLLRNMAVVWVEQVQRNNTETKHNCRESKHRKTQQNKTVLIQSPFTTLGQITR